MKTAIVIGRFQPITNAHYEIIQNAISSYDETYVVVINSITSMIANAGKRNKAAGFNAKEDEQFWEEKLDRLPSSLKSKNNSFTQKGLDILKSEQENNPFSGMTRKKLIYKAFNSKLHESKIISHPDANIEQIINKVYYSSKNTEFVILCGQDRKETYERQIRQAFEKHFFAPEINKVDVVVLQRDVTSADNISATKVREAIKADDKHEFEILTPEGIHGEYENLKRVIVERRIPLLFQRMLSEMTYIEDLNVKDFINFIKNIYKAEASIKLDGTAALAFGFDNEGKFFTGFGRDFKDIKPELKRYSVEEWLQQKNIFDNAAVSAHTFLEKKIPELRKYISNNETVVAELLFGDKPNCIKYDFSGINHLIILNNDKLAEALDGEKMNIDTVNFVIEADRIIPQAVKQVWKFGKTQHVDPTKYNIDVEEDLKELEIFLDSTTNGMRNIDIIGMRAAGKNRELVKKVREKAELYKLNIKEKLLQQFVRKVREGKYIPAEGYSHEGIVLKLGNERVKIIDKEVFKKIHDRDWAPVNAAKKIQQTMSKEDAVCEIDKILNDFDTLYPNIDNDMKIKMTNQLKMIKIFIVNKLSSGENIDETEKTIE